MTTSWTRAIVGPLSLAGMPAITKACKLYDYERRQWLGYRGRPNAPPIVPGMRVQDGHCGLTRFAGDPHAA